jgi:hypothetical protein
MFCQDFPFAYDLQRLLTDPEASRSRPRCRADLFNETEDLWISREGDEDHQDAFETADTDFRGKPFRRSKPG